MTRRVSTSWCSFALLFIFAYIVDFSWAATESEAVEFLRNLERQYSRECNKDILARWNYIVNVTTENEQISLNATNQFLQFQSTVQAQILNSFNNWQSFSDPLKREFQYLAIRGPATMPAANVAEMNQIRSTMEAAYAVTTVCEYGNPQKCDLRLEPEIEEKLVTVTDYDELEHYWTAWHDAMSKAVKPSEFTRFVQLQNEMAKANGFNDMSEMWLEPYNDGTAGWTAANFKRLMLDTWEQLKPFYRKLHAYVRMKLRQYPNYEARIKKYGYLPSNLMGNMWAQDWAALENRTKPFPNVPSLDATEAMKRKNYTTVKMFQEADQFFQGLGLPPMTETFWKESMLERPQDREVVCHASAEDFCLGVNSTDFRIKMCTNVNMEDLVTVHHEMGHIAYFMQYTNQHYVFRDGANPGFHEAIGDALALAVTTPKHLQCILGLDIGVSCDEDTAAGNGPHVVTETDINFLYIMALQKIAFFPFGISMDQWRWEVFEGTLQEEDYNDRWWELRQQNQGVAPPSERHPADFDPAAKYHIVANVPYIRYFVSHILQFQFYEAMCIAAGEYNPNDPNSKPLYQCDFAGSKNAGKLLGDMMALGFTKPWPEALQAITGSRGMSITPLLNYFAPLIELFDKELTAAGERDCFGRDCQPVASEYVTGYYEKAASDWCNRVSKADWAYNTDLNNATAEELSNAVNIAYSKFVLEEWTANISQFDYETFDDSDLTKRQLTFLNAVGISALPDVEIEEYNQVLSSMTKIYGNGKLCPYQNQSCDIEKDGLFLEPDLENILASSEDYAELTYVWSGWRNVSGKKMRQLYQRYVELSNVAAQLNGYDNMGDFWLLRYESDTFREEVSRLWETVKPLYEELHAYVRFRLSQKYSQVSTDAPLPAHVLGNMWAQTWENVYDKVLPYPGFPSFDITDVLKEKFTPDIKGIRDMFWVADDFFVSTGLANVSVAYGDNAMIVKPENKSVVCHASAWDFCDGKDFRIKMCANVDMEDFITIHHELGHIQYDIQYKDLPITLREGANPGFHEAIGDVIALSVATPKHMQKIGFLNSTAPSEESTVNYLMKIALDKVAFLPFGYLIDSYRWKIFDGSIGTQNYTYEWLKLRSTLQGIVPPVKRNEQDFDAGAKYHVPANTPYIRYFVSYILQFQVHKVLCEAAGELANGGLHECDIYENAAAGAKFKQILQAGASRNWKELLQEITGSPDLDATALLDYFQPLRRFLESQRQTYGYPVGWDANAFENYYAPN